MSEQNQGGGNRNRNRNNNNRNRNNNRNKNRNNKGRQRAPRKPKPLVLNFWQKILKRFGWLNEEKVRKQQEMAERINRDTRDSKPKKGGQNNKPNNTRVAKERKPQEEIAVSTPRLYVGNLSYDATETDIEELFKGVGTVKKAEVIYNRHTHRSKGYGFVQMLNVDEAKRAVDVLHEQPFLGRKLIVNGSKARKPNDKTGDSESAA